MYEYSTGIRVQSFVYTTLAAAKNDDEVKEIVARKSCLLVLLVNVMPRCGTIPRYLR